MIPSRVRRYSPPPQPPVPPSAPFDALTICYTPTYDGSGRVVHPSIVDMGPKRWNGYRWWVIDTPFPQSDDTLENPSISASHDRVNWEFPPGLVNPIDPWPGLVGSYNSDPELVWDPEGQRMVAYWRETYPDVNAPTRPIWTAVSSDGVTWEHQPTPTLVVPMTGPVVSPCVARVSARDWRMWILGAGWRAEMYVSQGPLGPWARSGVMTSNGGVFTAYHGDLIYDPRGAYFGLTQATDGHARPHASLDGVTWFTGDAPRGVGTCGRGDARGRRRGAGA